MKIKLLGKRAIALLALGIIATISTDRASGQQIPVIKSITVTPDGNGVGHDLNISGTISTNAVYKVEALTNLISPSWSVVNLVNNGDSESTAFDYSDVEYVGPGTMMSFLRLVQANFNTVSSVSFRDSTTISYGIGSTNVLADNVEAQVTFTSGSYTITQFSVTSSDGKHPTGVWFRISENPNAWNYVSLDAAGNPDPYPFFPIEGPATFYFIPDWSR